MTIAPVKQKEVNLNQTCKRCKKHVQSVFQYEPNRGECGDCYISDILKRK